MSSDDQSDKECPLCMEAFDVDDMSFYPCKCQYQICRFCWHRIRTNENGLCPACRQSYPEDPVNFQPLSSADLQKIKCEKKQKVQQQKNRVVESRKHLSEFRVLQKNLVYAVGLNNRMADPELLKRNEFFGKFGKIIKVAVGAAPAINSAQPAVHTAYITYTRSEDALRAIQAVNNMVVEGRFLKASLGTTKYCSNFLKGQSCHKPECMYLHEVAEGEISFTKEDMHQGKHTEYERRLHEQMASTGGGSVGNTATRKQHSQPAPLQQQSSFGNGRELAAMRHRAATTDKKRVGVAGGGSLENLTMLTSGGGGKKSASTTSQKQQQQQRVKGTTKGGVAIAATSGWGEQMTKLRGGSETREVLRNSRDEHPKNDTKRTKGNANKCGTGRKSVSPGQNNDQKRDRQQLHKTGSVEGTDHRHLGVEEDEETPSDSSPIPIVLAASVEDTTTKQWIDTGRSSSSPIPFSSSLPQQMPETNAMIQMNGDFTELQTLNQQQRIMAAKSNYFLEDEEHDDELGFDPFAESSKALEEIMEEEKNYTPPKSAEGHLHNGGTMLNNHHTSSSSHYFSGNNAFGSSSSILPKGHNQYTGPPPPGLVPFSSAYQQHQQNNQYGTTTGNHNFGMEGSQHNSLSDLRESFKAMLPNVNVRFVSNASNDQQHQQQQQHYGGYFGTSGNSSTSSLPAIPSSYHQGNDSRSHGMRSFVPSDNPYNFQHSHHPHQQHPFGGHQLQNGQQQQSSFGPTSSSFMAMDVAAHSFQQQQQNQQQQQKFMFGGGDQQQQQQRSDTGGGGGGWLPVPPGFSPRG